jgi:arginine repressor
VRKVQINPRTTAKDLVKMLEETGTKVSISTVKRVLYRHNKYKTPASEIFAIHSSHWQQTTGRKREPKEVLALGMTSAIYLLERVLQVGLLW